MVSRTCFGKQNVWIKVFFFSYKQNHLQSLHHCLVSFFIKIIFSFSCLYLIWPFWQSFGIWMLICFRWPCPLSLLLVVHVYMWRFVMDGVPLLFMPFLCWWLLLSHSPSLLSVLCSHSISFGPIALSNSFSINTEFCFSWHGGEPRVALESHAVWGW